MILSVRSHAATLVQRNALVVTQDVAGVALASLHAGGGRQVAEYGEEVGAGWRAGGGAVGVVAVGRARQGCREEQRQSAHRTVCSVTERSGNSRQKVLFLHVTVTPALWQA